MKDSDFLQWIWNRLHYEHGENRNVDYMLRLKRIIDKAAQQQESAESCQLPTTGDNTPPSAPPVGEITAENMEADELARKYGKCHCGGDLIVSEWQCGSCNEFICNP